MAKRSPSQALLTDERHAFSATCARLRERARKHIEEGAVIEGYGADRRARDRAANTALATELVCVLRYKRHYFMAEGLEPEPVAAEFLQHATEEQAARRRGSPRASCSSAASPTSRPTALATRAHSEYDDSEGLVEMIRRTSWPSASRSSPTPR